MRACGKTDVGLRRHENQDTFAVEQGEKLLIAVVCDGMGGAEGGQIASSVAVETFMKEMHALIRADMTAEQLRELASFCVAKANTAVYQRALQDPAYQGMGTTLVSAVAEEKYAIVCNIGDSRAYLIRGGEITRITHDHSVVQTLVENGNITAEEARTHPNRNLITARSAQTKTRSATRSRSRSPRGTKFSSARTALSSPRRTTKFAAPCARVRARKKALTISLRSPRRRARRIT